MSPDRDRSRHDEGVNPPKPQPPGDLQGREHLHGERTGSALGGKLDYADLAERVVQGVSVTLEEKKSTQE
jgi:hypothetical protein